MSSVTENLSPPPAPTPAEQRFVDEKIRRTRRALKTVDLVAGLITLAIGVLSYLLAMAVLEHWIVPGGLSPSTRALLLLVLLGGVAWYSWRYFWPLLTQPINPVYAAHTIEQGSPSLKNSLLNLLLLRDRRRQISRQVYQAIEHQAAQRLSQVPVDTTVDRSVVLRLGYVLVAVLAVCLLYRVLSPKDPIASAGRLLMPWSNIPVPSRVQILDVQPGDTSAARGEQVTISAEILGQQEDESVRLVYSQTDGQLIDQEIIMNGDEQSLRYSCRLPGRIALGSAGIQNDLTYRIEAGDARSPDFKISVFSQPTLVVERIRYEYPTYTRYPPREEAFTGDISAVEGTTITLYAVANQAIETAHVDFEADGRHDLLMNAEGTKASVRFQLELEEDRRTPKHESYVLRYTTTEGRRNPSPPKYQIDVQRDYSPEIELLEPSEEVLDVGLHEEVVLKLEARDPDFALHNVAILGEVAGERALKEALLSSDHTGRYEGRLKIVPSELNLQEGDLLEYWGAAADNRRPEPNISFTKHQKLRIVGKGPREPLPDNPQENQGEGEQGESGDQGGEGQQGEGQEGNAGGAGNQQQQGENSDQQQGSQGEGQQGEGSGQQQEGQQGNSAETEGQEGGEQNGSAEGQSSSENQNDVQQQGEQESGKGGSDGQGSEEQGRVSPDGDNDSEAFRRMADHFNEQDQNDASDSSGEPQAGDQQQQSGESQDAQAQSEGSSQSEEGDQESGAEQTDNSAGEQQGENSQQGQPEQQAGGEQEQQQDRSQQQPAESQGAQGEGDQQEPSREGKQGGEQQQGDSPNGEMNKEQGSEGAGQNPGENQGSPDPGETQKPSEKSAGQSDDSQLNEQEAPSDSKSQKESDSEGGQGGDRSGGGQEGAGQQADEQGTGAAGEHESAEDGAGESSQQGEGETGNEAGDQAQAEGETGEWSGDQQGEGSQQGQQPGDQAGGEQSANSEQGGQQGESTSKPSETGGKPDGGGTGSNNTPPPPSTGDPLPGDEANLDYARQQTDLVLNRLEDQLKKKQVDEDLLDKLGWTPEELQRFVQRWKNLKDKAAGSGPDAQAAQEELDISLQSLGLNQERRQGFEARSAKDKLRDLKESIRVRTPLEFEELMRTYVRGTASAEEE